ncbi:uncharacterized protein B0J16DRAFT_318945 [Fusarium flagelliforme]|uniref:uncharacterized protein n=1 Tax=Fusarium flagelliforme TaxID=2675880 RepID=UPI001E8E847E|nr:uncharacterized protein B0J16DRAFT_318945 [Fusarium flagelliforme]KAH7189310.1 hypothetical protein B0J16DRAFT_318945 [Fusarium flagelliforme]
MLEDVKFPYDEIYEVDCDVILGDIVQQSCDDWAKSKLWMVKGLSGRGKLLANSPQVDVSATSYQTACFVIRAQVALAAGLPCVYKALMSVTWLEKIAVSARTFDEWFDHRQNCSDVEACFPTNRTMVGAVKAINEDHRRDIYDLAANEAFLERDTDLGLTEEEDRPDEQREYFRGVPSEYPKRIENHNKRFTSTFEASQERNWSKYRPSEQDQVLWTTKDPEYLVEFLRTKKRLARIS